MEQIMTDAEILADYHYRPMPTPTADIIKYAKDKISNPGHTMKEGYFRGKEQFIYLEQISKWRATNNSNCSYLNILLKESNKTESEKDIIKEMLEVFDNNTWNIYEKELLQELASYAMPLTRSFEYGK